MLPSHTSFCIQHVVVSHSMSLRSIANSRGRGRFARVPHSMVVICVLLMYSFCNEFNPINISDDNSFKLFLFRDRSFNLPRFLNAPVSIVRILLENRYSCSRSCNPFNVSWFTVVSRLSFSHSLFKFSNP